MRKGICKGVFEPLWLSISFYSILPAPHFEWSEKNTKAVICYLPLSGIFVGSVFYLWRLLCIAVQLNISLFAVVAVIIPIVITGGLHMDGFLDVADAISSHQTRERKLEIMKDSHVGAFAVIWCSVYLLLSFGLYSALYERGGFWVISVGFILSRSLCALSALTLPNVRKEGLLFTFNRQSKNTWAKSIMCALALICIYGMIFAEGWTGVAAAVLAVLAFFVYRLITRKQFGGMTGDTCGFFIELCELCVLIGALAGSYII